VNSAGCRAYSIRFREPDLRATTLVDMQRRLYDVPSAQLQLRDHFRE
jgi:hypothetical protein